MIKVILADDHPIILNGLCQWLESEADVELLATASTLYEAQALLDTHQPDVAILDFRMPGMLGAQSIEPLVKAGHKLIIFSFLDDPQIIGLIQAAGARAFVSKHASVEVLMDALRRVHDGECLFPTIEVQTHPHEQLSNRERLVFNQLILGRTPKEIAYELEVATSSVYTYSERVRRKVGVDSTQALIQYAYDVGLLNRNT